MRLTFASNPNVEIIPIALGAEEGEANMVCHSTVSNLEGIGLAESESVMKVKVMPLDKLFEGQTVNYIKADLEGFELNMLEGAKELIRRSKPRIAITTYHKVEHASEIARILRDINPSYRIKCKGVALHGGPLMLHAWT